MRSGKFFSIIGFSLLILLASCQSDKNKKIAEIRETEKILFAYSDGSPDIALAEKLTGLYTAYAEKYPDDSLATEYLFKAAEVTSGIGKPEQAYEMFASLYNKYPDSHKAPLAIFMQGFVAETRLFDKEKARNSYLLFLEKYPQHNMARDVKFSLDNLDKTDEELIKQFEEMNASIEEPS